MAKVIGFKIEIIGTEEQARQLGVLNTSTKKVAEETKKFQKALERINKEQVKDTEAIKNVNTRIGESIAKKLELSAQTNKLRQEIRQEISLQNTSAGSIGRVNAELAIEKRRIKDIEIGSRDFKRVAKRIKDLETKQRDFNEILGRGRTFVGEYERGTSAGFKKIANTIDKTNDLLEEQRREIKKLVVGSKQFNVVADNIKQLERQQKRFNDQIKRSVKAIDSFQRVAVAVGGALVAFRTLQRITGGAVDAVVDFDDSIANLRKTTGLANAEAVKLAKNVLKIDTKTSVTNLLALSSAAGRLGLRGKDVVDFTREVDKAFVSLGDSLEGDAAEIGLTLGKIAANFDLEERFGIGEAINKVGSSLNELGANSKAQEGAIIDFTKRLSGVASQARISVPDIQALGALFDETGQSIEIAGTTIQKLLPAIGKDLQKFAKIAGLDVKEFRKVVEKDAFEALKLVAVGAQSSEEGLLGLTETLENFGIKSGRAAGIVGILAGNTDRLAELQKISNDAFEEGTSLTKEFNIQNNTLSARIAKAAKGYEAFIIRIDEGTSVISSTVGLIVGVITELFNLAAGTEKASSELTKIEQTSRNVAEAVIFLSKAILAVTVGFVAYKAVLIANTVRLKLLNAATVAQSFVTGILNKKTRQATIAMLGFNKATKANVVGAVIGLLLTAATAFFSFRDSVRDATEEQREFNKEAERLQELLAETENIEAQISILDQFTEAQAESLKQRIEDNIKANSDQLLNVKAQNKKLIDEAKKQDEQLKNLTAFKVETLAEIETRLDEERAAAFRVSLELARLTEEKKAELTAEGLIAEFEANKESLEAQKALVEARIAEFEREKDARNDLTKAEQKAINKLIEAQKKLFDDLVFLNSTAFEKENKLFLERRKLLELDLIGRKVSEEEARRAIQILEKEHQEALDKIREDAKKKRTADAQKEIQEQSKRLDQGLRVAIRVENERFVAGEQSRKDLNEAIRNLNEQRVRDELELVNRELDQQLALTEGILDIDLERNEVILKQKEDLLQELAELDVEDKEAQLDRERELQEQRLELQQSSVETIVDVTAQLLDRQSRNNSLRLRRETDEVNKNEQSKLDSLKNRLDQGLISEGEFERGKSKISEQAENDRIEIQRRASEKQKTIDTSQAIIAGALAVQRILSTIASPELITDQLLKGIAIAGVVTTTALNVDAIQSQNFAGGGLIPGRFDAKDDIPIRISRGEAIVNPAQQRALGGSGAFKRAGVPGFQGGGVPLPTANLSAVTAQAVQEAGFTREEAIELIQEGVATIKVEQVETETREIAEQVDLIETTAEV